MEKGTELWMKRVELSWPIGKLSHNYDGVVAGDYIVADPYDLAPAEQILAAVIDAEIESLEPDEKLVILIGEHHAMASHQMIQAGVLHHLAARRDHAQDDGEAANFVFAFEASHNLTAELARHVYGLDVEEALDPYMKAQDPDYEVAIQAFVAADEIGAAGLEAHKYLFQQAVKHRIATVFNDAVADEDGILEIDHPAAQSALEALQERYNMADELDEGLSVYDEKGLALRNAVMVANAHEKAEKEKSRIIVQGAGLAHVLGDQNQESYQDSLAALYSAAGYRVLPILMHADWESDCDTDISDLAWSAHKNSVVIRGLSDQQFFENEPEKEKAYFSALSQAYSGAASLFGDEGAGRSRPEDSFRQAKDALRDVIEKAKCEAGKNSPRLPPVRP